MSKRRSSWASYKLFLGLALALLSLNVAGQQDRAVAMRQTEHSAALEEAKRLGEEVVRLYGEGKYLEAIPFAERGLGIAERVLGPEHPDTSTSLNNLATLYKSLGQYARVEPLYQRALAIAEKALGPEHSLTSTYINNLAALYAAMGQYSRAEPLYVRALSIIEKALGPENPALGPSLINLAGLYRDMGQYARAEPILKRSLAIAEKFQGTDHPSTGVYLNSLAELYRVMGEYAQAESLFQRALAILERAQGTEHPDTGLIINNLGLLYTAMGQYHRAEPLHVRALAIAERAYGKEHPVTGVFLTNLASLYQSSDQYSRVEAILQRALAIAEKAEGPEHPSTGRSLNNLAVFYQHMGQHARAEALLVRALAIVEKTQGSEHPHTGASFSNLAAHYQAMGEYAQAESLFQRALAIREKALSLDHPDTAASLGNLAFLAHKQGQHEAAILLGKRAVNTLQAVRGRLHGMDREHQQSFLKSKESYYQTVAGWLIDAGRLAEAQEVLAMLKEEEYHQFIRRDAAADPRATRASYSGVEIDFNRRWDAQAGESHRLAQELLALDERAKGLAQLDQALPAADEARRKTLRQQLRAADEAHEALLAEIRTTLEAEAQRNAKADARRTAALERRLQDTSPRQGLLADLARQGRHAVLLEYVLTEAKTYILVTSAKGVSAQTVAIPVADLHRQIEALRGALRDPRRDPRPAARELHAHLIAPIQSDLDAAGVDTLMLSLDGALRYIPYAALFDGKQYLAERYNLAYYNLAAQRGVDQPPGAVWRVSGFGLSQPVAGHVPLPGVKDELAAINSVLPGPVYLDQAFNRGQFERALDAGRPVLHVASHFVFRPGSEVDSYLVLGDGQPLSLDQMRSLSFTDVELLALSACETGMGGGKDANGREVEGFGALAQDRGAKGVLATLWKVADGSTAKLMQRFYQLRQEKKLTKAEALRQAQMEFIRAGKAQDAHAAAQPPSEPDTSRAAGNIRIGGKPVAEIPAVDLGWAHPYYWAPFVLMGNWL